MVNLNKILTLFLLLSSFSGITLLNCNSKLANNQKKITKILSNKKIVYINSYHNGYAWSDKIEEGFLRYLNINRLNDGTYNSQHKTLSLSIFRMNSKRNQSDNYLKNISESISAKVKKINPDIIIASDDNASKYIISPYFSNSEIPVIFCGINWDVSIYGFPTKNITGMIEVQLINELVNRLSKYAKGKRVAYLKGRDRTAIKESYYFERQLGYTIIKKYVTNIKDWKKEFLYLQNNTDILLVGNMVNVNNWSFKDKKLKKFILDNTTIPTGAWDTWMSPYTLLTVATIPEEQGEWAAKTCLKVLSGTPINNIPIVTNIKSKKIINPRIAHKLSIRLDNSITREYEILNNNE